MPGRVLWAVFAVCQKIPSRPPFSVEITNCERFSRYRSSTRSMATPRRVHERTGVSSTSPNVTWDGSTASGHEVEDGTYQVTVCYKDSGRPLPSPPIPIRPGAAEASVRRPPWHTTGCAAAHVVRVERLAAFVDSTGST